jgi:hypothetical protein
MGGKNRDTDRDIKKCVWDDQELNGSARILRMAEGTGRI